MSMKIAAIVYAEDRKEALHQAENIFQRLCDQGDFEYYTLDKNGTGFSRKNNWGNLSIAVHAEERRGKKLIQDAMDSTKEELFRNLQQIREWLEALTDQQIWDRKGRHKNSEVPFKDDSQMLRKAMYNVGKYGGSGYRLYDDNGCAIRDLKFLKNVLNKWACLYEDKGIRNPCEELDVFVVPVE